MSAHVHYIEAENYNIAFFPASHRFFKVNQDAMSLIEALSGPHEKTAIMQAHSLSEEDYYKYEKYVNENLDDLENQERNQKQNEKILSRLVIHLTNDCNLRCKYCYANGGSYLSERSILNQGTLDQILSVFFGFFDQIQRIQFFGGEPLMNIPMMEYCCKKITEMTATDKRPVFGVITNGTIINDHLIELINEYKINVTFSYDGNPEVNDIMRIKQDGSGTSQAIIENIRRLKKATNQPELIEVTYNNYHVQANIGILDVVNHIKDIDPDLQVHLVPAGCADDSPYGIDDLSMFPRSVKEICEYYKGDVSGKVIPSYSLAERVFNNLRNTKAKSSLICDAGLGTISVSTQGDIYPCFMFTDNPKMKLGNIYDQNVFTSEKYAKQMNRIFDFSVKDNNPECQKCFIKDFCSGCLGINAFQSGDPFTLSEKNCDMYRGMFEEGIRSLIRLEDLKKETQ